MKNKFSDIFLILSIVLAVIVLAGGAAYFSVFGLSRLFAGSGIGVIIFAGIELGKLVAISAIYRKWDILKKKLKYYLSGLVVIAMIITSLGVYAFLVNSYQSTKYNMENRDSKIQLMVNKKNLFEKELSRYNTNIETSTNRINTISGIRNNQERRLDTLYMRRSNTGAKRTETLINSSDEQINILNKSIENNMKESNRVNDSISYYDQKILELKSSDISKEIGPLKYISELTGFSMDNVVTYLTLLIIFLVDPFAIGLLLLFNELTMNSKNDSDKKLVTNFFRKKEEDIQPEIKEYETEPVYIPSEEPKEKEVVFSPPLKTINLDNLDIRKEEVKEDEIEEEEVQVTKKNDYSLEPCQEGYSEEKIILNKSDIKEGLKVYHNTFGRGIILKSDVEKNRVLINFEDFGIKELNPDFANLSQLICIENVKYLDFAADDPEIQDIIIKQTPIEDEDQIEEEDIIESTIPIEKEIEMEEVEKKTKLIPKILKKWRGKKMI